MTQAEIDRNHARLLELAEEKTAAMQKQSTAYAADKAAREHFYECRHAVLAIVDERDAILDSLSVYKVERGVEEDGGPERKGGL